MYQMVDMAMQRELWPEDVAEDPLLALPCGHALLVPSPGRPDGGAHVQRGRGVGVGGGGWGHQDLNSRKRVVVDG